MVVFKFYLQSGKQKKIRVNWGGGGGDSHVVFGQKFPREKINERQCADVMQEPVLLLPKFVELTVWPARANSLWTILFMQRK
jgi:hypothetical protein